MIKKIVALLICFVMCIGFVGCAKNNENVEKNDNTTEYKPLTIEDNGVPLNEYKIVIGNKCGESICYAGKLLQDYIFKATEINLPIIKDTEPITDKEIIIGNTNRNQGNIDFDSLGVEGYVVKTNGNNLLIGGNERGSIYGVFAYLEVLGYRFYTPQVTYIPYDNEVFIAKEINLEWKPVYEFRDMVFYTSWNADWALSQCINSEFGRDDFRNNAKYGGYMGYVGGPRMMVHTAQYFLPQNLYSSHPEYFSNIGNHGQPCWSNKEALDVIYDNMKIAIKNDPHSTMVALSMNDNSDKCECNNCKELRKQYGETGEYYQAINYIAKKLSKDYPDMILETIAYADFVNPPENIVIEDNVVVKVCTSNLCNWHTNPEKCERISSYIDLINNWKKIVKKIYIYSYPINWSNIYSVHCNFDNIYYQMNLFAELGVKGVYVEAYPVADPEFGELKAYLHAKLLKNPFMSKSEYEYYLKDFIDGYYGDAGEFVLTYIKEVEKLIINMIDEDIENGRDHIRAWFSQGENLPYKWNKKEKKYDKTFIDRFNNLWDEAEENAGENIDHVKKSRIHWTYSELCNTWDKIMEYGTNEEKEELIVRCENMYTDIKKYGILKKYSNSSELGNIDDFRIMPPYKWWR